MPPSILRILRPSPFTIGLAVVLGCCLLFISFGGRKPTLLEDLDNRFQNAMFRVRGTLPVSGQVAIVDIDEKSLRKLGQWPWPRTVVASLIENMKAASPKVIGLDIVFAEPDRTSPKNFVASLLPHVGIEVGESALRELQSHPALDNDTALGASLSGFPIVLGYYFETESDGLKQSDEKPFPSLNLRVDAPGPGAAVGPIYSRLALPSAYRAVINTPGVATAETEGFFTMTPDPSGQVRKVPLFMEMDGAPYPSLAFEMLRLGNRATDAVIHVSPSDGVTILGVTVAGRFIPTGVRGEVFVNFRGPARTFSYLSAVDLVEGRAQDALNDKFVLIGASAAGLLDLRATPLSPVFPGVEVHATIIDNFLANDFFRQDLKSERGITLLFVLAGGLFITALLSFASPLAGGLGTVLALLLLVTGNYRFFFLQNHLVGITYPFVSILSVFMVVTLFNFFFAGREKRFIQNAFGHYVSPTVVGELMKDPKKLSLSGEDRVVSIFFSDIRGFTSISEKMTSGELGRFMNEYLTAMSDIVMRHQGTVDKYIGDAIMAIWGAPLDDPEHAANAVRASLAMVEKLKSLRPGWEARGLPFVDIGCGVNTGMVSVGNFGSEQRFDYTVLGDNVNLASRLEGSNKAYGTNIIVSEYTREALGDEFCCRFVDLVRVKGKARPVALYEPLLEGAPEASLREQLARFHEAVDQYRNRRFEEALEILLALQQESPCRLYSLYRERAASFLLSPPSEDWDGVFTFTTK